MRDEVRMIFEKSVPGHVGFSLPNSDVPDVDITSIVPKELLGNEKHELPEVSEIEVVRHYVELSTRNHGVDSGFYPLGSCTMKYNPKINEDMARLPGLAGLHPHMDDEGSQGALEMMYNLQNHLAEITGMDAVTLQPVAGAHGELVGLMLIDAYHKNKGRKKTTVLVPDSAHGTNPASAAMAGFKVVEVKSNCDGGVCLDDLKDKLSDDVAALMLTNPSTLGLFETNIVEIAELVHGVGGLLYYDGANANAIMGYTRPGCMGFDVVHLNLHKTFSTPHGGGGPGSGPVGVKKELIEFLPAPMVEKDGDKYFLNYNIPKSIGRVHGFYGNFGVNARAYSYILTMGGKGLKQVSEDAVLNANYIMEHLKEYYQLPFDRTCMHEFVFSGKPFKKFGVRTLDIAKALLDYGYHPPTIYFPLIVEEALMIEPTETESKETLDKFIEAMKNIAITAQEDPEKIISAPHKTFINRLDEVGAARNPVVCCALNLNR